MERERIRELLEAVRGGGVSVEEALEALRDFPTAQLAEASLDTRRALRRGFPEVVLGVGKQPEQIRAIAARLLEHGGNVLVTRVDPEVGRWLVSELRGRGGAVHATARAVVFRQREVPVVGRAPIAVVAAGTSDLPVAEEAALTCELMGNEVRRVRDVGVAGIHRLGPHLGTLREAGAIVVVAGMEGALPSVVAGLVARPVVAVPTSVGYGASFGGIAALLGMLNACAAGVTVVNIDNGFGGGYAAALMNRREPL